LAATKPIAILGKLEFHKSTAYISPRGRRQFKYDREGEEGLAQAIAGDRSPLRAVAADSKGVELILGIIVILRSSDTFLDLGRHQTIWSFLSSYERRTDTGLYGGLATASSP
jgi:hypothetical protein